MYAISTQRFTIFGPSKLGNRITLDRSSDTQLGTLIHSHISHGTSERGSALFHALLHSALDGHVGIGSGHTFITEGNSRESTFVSGLGGFKDQTESAIVIDKRLDASAVRFEVLLVFQPPDAWSWMASHFS